MKIVKNFALIIMMVSIWVGCSDVSFHAQETATCANFTGDCALSPDGNTKFSDSVRAGRVDILFVDDNSGSMSTEQKEMGDKFPNFINNISDLDYHIAIVTTDISASPNNSTPRAANGNGDFQDGKFLKFDNGDTVLTNATTDVVDQFRDTIERPETLECDQHGHDPAYCPSGDERGIYAVNMALDRSDSHFFRQGAHLAVVILSDEDERSNGGNITGYPLEPYDLPETLVSKVKEVFGATKTISVHSVIVRPGDSACLSAQDNQGSGVKGFYGTHYARLSQPDDQLKALGSIITGHLGSICASDYGAQLGDIASKISDNVNHVQLLCDPVKNSDGSSTLSVTFDPAQPGITYTVNSEHQIVFDPVPPANTTVNYSYECPRNI